MAEAGHGLNLSCSICFEEFKIPKVLPCGHTFCCQCICKMVDRYSSLQCPTCRKDIFLPESGKVEDFPTNFALMNFIPDKVLDKNRTKKRDQLRQKVDSVCECPKHKTPMEFYCKSCEKQICNQCLLKDHKPDKHNIVTASDIATNLSGDLQNLKKKLQHYTEKEKVLGEKILKGLDYHQQDKNRLEQEIKLTLEREQEKLKKVAENLLNELNKKVEGRVGTYADLKMQHDNLQTLSNQIHENCEDLNQHIKQLRLSQSSSKIKQVSKSIETLKDALESLTTVCQSTPIKVGLCFTPASTWQLGKLTRVSSKPMILKSTEFTNKKWSQKVKTHTQGNDDFIKKDESCKDLHEPESDLGPDLDMGVEHCDPGDECAHKRGNARCDDQNKYDEQDPYRYEYGSYLDHLPDDEDEDHLQPLYLDDESRDAFFDEDDLLEAGYAHKYGHLDGNLPLV